MGFGSKGLDAPVIIGIILAVIAAAIILYILWSKGMLPFVSGANEAECTAYFIRGCQEGQADYFSKSSNLLKNTACAGFGKSKFPTTYGKCFPGVGGQANCESFCNEVLAT